MSPTRVRTLALVAAVAAAIGWGTAELVHGQTGRALPVPWLSAATMWLLAAGLLAWTLLARPRLLRKPGARPMPPLVAARSAALAMAASRTGAIVGGFYAGVAVAAIGQRMTEAGSDALVRGGIAALGSAALVAIALWLERLCRLPQDHDDDERGTPATALRPARGTVAPADRVGP